MTLKIVVFLYFAIFDRENSELTWIGQITCIELLNYFLISILH